MARRSRRFVAGALTFAACAAAAGAPPAEAYTWVYSDITNFNLTETTSTYGGGTQFHISSTGDGVASYRWVDSPSKDTVISGNNCSDYGLFGKSSISVGDTGYHSLFSAPAGNCFVLRGRTAAGEGSMSLYDGRLQR